MQAARGPLDISLLGNHLKGNPLTDWLDRFGPAMDDLRSKDDTNQHAGGDGVAIARFVERVERAVGVGATVVEAGCNEKRTAAAVAEGATVVLNPMLSAFQVAVRPHALLAREALPAVLRDSAPTDAASPYVVVQCVAGRADKWRTSANRPIISATCVISQAAMQRPCHDIAERVEGSDDSECADATTPAAPTAAPSATATAVSICASQAHVIGVVLGGADDGGAAILDSRRESDRVRTGCREASEWVHALRAHGHAWSPLRPERWEMTPNMHATALTPWDATLRDIAAKTGEMTQLYYCSQRMKRRAFQRGLRSFHDMHGYGELSELQSRIVWANHPSNRDGARVQPRRLRHNGAAAQRLRELARAPWFATDFETVLTSDPPRQWIFMIATTLYVPAQRRTIEHHITLRNLTEEEQESLVKEWLEWVEQQARAYGANAERIPMLHWSKAEPCFLARAQCGGSRDDARRCAALQWVDVLDMFKQEEIVVAGALDYKLKSIAKALHRLGHIATSWEEALQSGYAATRLAQRVYATRRTRQQHEAALADIRKYNQIDTRVLVEIVHFLMTRL